MQPVRLLAVTAVCTWLTGCGPAGPATYPVSGTLALTGGEVSHLAGSTIEVASDADPTVRAAGEIQPDGRFTLETLHAGAMRRGAREGTYKVRVVLSDDDPATRKRAAKAIAPKYLKFDTSGLTLRVPADDDVTLPVTAK